MPPDLGLFLAPDFNNGKPGGKKRWVVSSKSPDKTHYVTVDTLEEAIEIIRRWTVLWV